VDDPLPEWGDRTCVVCPAQLLGPGRFDVVDRPGRDYAYDPQVGWRVDRAGNAVCVHPFRVGLPVGDYASGGEPLPDLTAPTPAPSSAALELPDDVVDLEGWLVATLRTAHPNALFSAVSRAEEIAAGRFAPDAVVKALRRVLSVELAGR
jgi:hypothetical protein